MAQKKLLQEGQTIKLDGQDLQIVQSLSSGLTGEVYKALLNVTGQKEPVSVVVKAMKTLDFPLARQLFYKEGETLALLMHLEEETPDSLADNLKIAPVYYGLGEYQPEPDVQGFPYLVMEFINGTKVPDLLKQGTLPEKQALTIAWHLYRILDILHTRLLKTFIDLKFENLWWLEDKSSKWGGQLKLTDFGTLEEIKPGGEKKRGVIRDRLLGGVYLLSMLTGKTLEYSIGELKQERQAKLVIEEFEKDMTWGTCRLLRKLLHGNVDARFKNTADVLKELRQLVNFWSQTPERLSEMAQKSLAAAESVAEQAKDSKQPLDDRSPGDAAAARACSAMDILRIKAPQLFNERDMQRAKELLSRDDYFERGYALLQGRSFTLARQTFEEGLSWTDETAVLRRWSYMAAIGERITPSIFEANLKSGEEFLNLVNSGQFDSALNIRLLEFGQQLQSDGLQWLEEDAKMYLNFNAAQKAFVSGNFSRSAEFYLITLTHFAKLPSSHQEIIKKDELGDLRKLAEQAQELAKSTERSLTLYQEAESLLENGKFDLVVKAVQDAYEADKTALFRFEKLRELTEIALKLVVKNPEYLRVSRHIADVGLHDFGKERDLSYDNICEASAKLELAMQYLSNSDHVDFCAKIEEAHALLGEQGSLVEGVAVYAAGRASQQPLFLNALADSVEKLVPSSEYPAKWRRMAAEVSQARSTEYHKQVDDLMLQVYDILLPIMPYANNPKSLAEILQVAADHSHYLGGLDFHVLQNRRKRLGEAKTLVDKMRKLIRKEGEYRWEEFEQIRDTVSDGLQLSEETMEKQAQVQSEEYESRKDALSREFDQIQEKLNWVKNNPPEDFESDSQVALYQPLRRQLIDFLYRCYQIKSAFQNTTELDILINRSIYALNMLGGASWKQLLELASKHIEFFETTFKQASEDFAIGNLEHVRVVLDSTQAELGSTPEWQDLNDVFAKARGWKIWCESKSELFQSAKADARLLRDLRSFPDKGLPAVYWEHSPADAYLDQALNDLQTDLQSDIKSSNIRDERLVNMIRDLLDVTWTKRSIVSNGERREWRMTEWLQGAYELARNKSARGLLDHIIQTLPPENVDDALTSFTYQDWENLHLAERRRGVTQGKHRGRGQTFLLTGGIASAVCLMLVAVGFVGYTANQERILQIMNGTYTPTPTLTLTVTPTPTLTPTITLTPTKIPTLTPVPPSKFLLRETGSLYPASPVIGDAYWLMNDTDAILAPPVGVPALEWQEAKSKDKNAKNEPFVYTVTGNTNVTWIMDTPFDTQGYYQVFILDTQEFSSQQQTFNVFIDEQMVLPYRGTNQVIFKDAQQKNDAWVSLGIYQANAGQTLAVQLDLGQLTDKTPFAVDRLLVVRLNESTRQMLDQLPSGRPLVSLLDDPAVKFFEVVGGEPILVKDRGEFFNDVQAWNGSLTSRPLNEPLTIPVWVEWTPENRLPAGTYEVYVWIPAQHATIVADYFLLADGKVVERPNPAMVNQKDHLGVWLSLGTWDLSEESAVSLRLVVAAGATGEIGVDAVAIVKVVQ